MLLESLKQPRESTYSLISTNHVGLADGGAAAGRCGRAGPPLVLRAERLGGEGEAAELRADQAVLHQEHLQDVAARARQQGQLEDREESALSAKGRKFNWGPRTRGRPIWTVTTSC